MEKYKITMGDFLKNAGIVGLKYLLDTAKAQEDKDFGISEKTDRNSGFPLSLRKMRIGIYLYFRAFVQYFGPYTAYQGVLDKIDLCLEKIKNDKWKNQKNKKKRI